MSADLRNTVCFTLHKFKQYLEKIKPQRGQKNLKLPNYKRFIQCLNQKVSQMEQNIWQTTWDWNTEFFSISTYKYLFQIHLYILKHCGHGFICQSCTIHTYDVCLFLQRTMRYKRHPDVQKIGKLLIPFPIFFISVHNKCPFS